MKKLSLVLGLLLILGLLVACGDVTPTSGPVATTAVASTTSQTIASADAAVKEIKQATTSGDYSNSLDSTPDPEGTTIYFTATGPKGQGVFKVPAVGGAASEVFTGAPFVAPRGIYMSADGKQLFVTDPQAGGSSDKAGQIFVLSPAGGTPAPLMGSQGTAPQNLDIVTEGGQTVIYFTGKDPASGQPALLKLSAAGAQTPTVVVKGAPLVTPDGVAVTSSGVIYVADRTAAGGEMGKIFKVESGSLKPVVEKVKTGLPAGIALTPDQSTLLVSAHQLENPSDQVLVLNLSTLQVASVTKVVGQNQAAGGVHLIPGGKQAYFSWSDLTAGSPGGGRARGQVYGVTLQ